MVIKKECESKAAKEAALGRISHGKERMEKNAWISGEINGKTF